MREGTFPVNPTKQALTAKDGLTYVCISLDIELLQARWVLGNTSVDELVKAAVSLLEDGFDGTALQQLAGLSQPTLRDVGDLPSRAFAEMGLKSINPNEAVALLIARACNNSVVSALYEAFPNFGNSWKSKKSVVYSGGPYSDMGEFARFVIEDAYEKGNLDETGRAFQFLEKLLVEADQDTRNLVGYGFFETLRNVAPHRPGGDRPYEQFLGPISKEIWAELHSMRAGKSSLADVIRAERKADGPRSAPINGMASWRVL